MTLSPQAPSNSLPQTILAGGGEMGALMRSHDWSQTPLGPVESWSQSLRTAVSICLSSTFPLCLLWGQELIQLYNDAYRPICGAKHPQTLGSPGQEHWSEIWHILDPLFEGVFQTGQPAYVENLQMFLNRNGYLEEVYLTFSFSPICDESGEVAGIFHPIMETTAQVISSRRLRTLSDLGTKLGAAKTLEECCQIAIATLSHNAADIPFVVLYLLADDGKRLQLCGTTGWNKDWYALPPVIDISALEELEFPFAQAIHTTQVELVEIASHKDCNSAPLNTELPKTKPLSALALPLIQPGQDRLTGLLIAGISPHRSLNSDYQRFFELVAGQVTTAMTNVRAYEEERLRAEALAELDRAKTTFFNNVSHEFRTPLTLMLSPLQNALTDRDDPLSQHQRQRMEVVQRNSLRLLKLVNTLLDFSRIESDRVGAVYEPTDLATLTSELASVFRAAIEGANLRLVVDCPPLPDPIYVDREMWEKIVLNLLSNAIKFTFAGEITVRLRSLSDGRSANRLRHRVELAIQDTGIGIPAAEITHLFERFHRVKGARGRTFEGSGIGLSLVAELVKLHGGTVQVNSVEGNGSCFTVSIPTGSAHLPQEQIGTTQTLTSTALGTAPYIEEAVRWLPEEAGERVSLGAGEHIFCPPAHLPTCPPAHILLVDDNADMRDYLRGLLSQYWQVETAANGALALSIIQDMLPDLVLTDVMMPQLDGFQLLHALRNHPQTKGIPIILLSARAGEEAAIEGLQAGADDYLIKPFSARELITRVNTHLRMSRLRQEQSANRFKDQFLMTVTHELQAPLAAILAWARLLQSQPFDQPWTARALATIERNANIEAKLIKDLLDVASILSGKLCLQPQPVALMPLVKDAIASLRPTAEAKTIQLIETMPTTVSQASIQVSGDTKRLRQIVSNLLSNAIKFTPAGGKVEVCLSTLKSHRTFVAGKERMPDDDYAQIQIKDTGIGINAEFLPYVFDRFRQAEVPSRHSPGGVGIGGAIARHLVELHGGTIEVVSEGEGRGATFTVKLPLV